MLITNLEREFQSSSTIENIHFTSYKKPESPKIIEKIVVHLFENTSAENLAKAPGIGIKKAKELVNKIKNTAESDQKKLIEF